MTISELPSELNARLSTWVGVRAEAWDYSVGHSILRVHLSRGPNGLSALLYMYACKSVSFSSHWDDAAISVSQESHGQLMYLVTDGTHLRVECGNVYLAAPLSSYSAIPLSASDPPPGYGGAG